MGTIREEVESGQVDADLRDALNRALRDLAKAKASKEELVAAVYRAVDDNLKALAFGPVQRPTRDRRLGKEETAIIAFSDLQLSQVTPTFNTEVAEKRVELFAEKILRLIDLQRSSHPVRRAKVYFIGDLVEGEQVYAGQAFQIDSSLFAQTTLHGPRILTNFLRTLLTSLDGIDVVSVPGNHGRVGRNGEFNPETNADRMLSSIVKMLFEASGEKRVTWRIPDGYGRNSWYAVDGEGLLSTLLWHGHQARRTSSSSHLPFYKLVLGWRAGAIPEPFNLSICGHHHVPTMLNIGPVTHFINGTFSSDSEYAVERLASNAQAAQWLLFGRPDRGVTASYLANLED